MKVLLLAVAAVLLSGCHSAPRPVLTAAERQASAMEDAAAAANYRKTMATYIFWSTGGVGRGTTAGW